MTKGWKRDSARHALASRGVKTSAPKIHLYKSAGPSALDPGIEKYLLLINSHEGLKTYASCTGHRIYSEAYISIRVKDRATRNKWMDKLEKYFDIEYWDGSGRDKFGFDIRPKGTEEHEHNVYQSHGQYFVTHPIGEGDSNSEFFKKVKIAFRTNVHD